MCAFLARLEHIDPLAEEGIRQNTWGLQWV